MSTGLREETYDVVITAGGFATDAINPLDITVSIRLLSSVTPDCAGDAEGAQAGGLPALDHAIGGQEQDGGRSWN